MSPPEVVEDPALVQAERILTDRFGIGPISWALPKGLQTLGLDIKYVPGLSDERAWERVLGPAWGTLSRVLAEKRCGVSMWMPTWLLEAGDPDRIVLTIVTEPDPAKIMEAFLAAA